MRFVPVKSEAQQAALMLHRARDLLVRQRTQLINAVRGHLAEFGIIEAQGAWNLPRVLAHLETEGELPEAARQILRLLAAQLDEAEQRIEDLDARIAAWHKASPASQRLASGSPAARDHPRHRAAGRHGDHGHHCRSQHLPQRPGVRRLARARAEAAIDRRKAAAGPDQP
jgi:transposase